MSAHKSHTPGCGCGPTKGTPWETEALPIVFCPLHAAAPEMKELLSKLYRDYIRDTTPEESTRDSISNHRAIRDLLSRIEGDRS